MSLKSSFKIPRNDILIGLTWLNWLLSRLLGGAKDTGVAPGDSHLYLGHSLSTRKHCELKVYVRGACRTLDFFSIFFLQYSSNCILFSFHGICNGLNVYIPSKLICWSSILRCDCEEINDCFLSHLICAIFLWHLKLSKKCAICCPLKQSWSFRLSCLCDLPGFFTHCSLGLELTSPSLS